MAIPDRNGKKTSDHQMEICPRNKKISKASFRRNRSSSPLSAVSHNCVFDIVITRQKSCNKHLISLLRSFSSPKANSIYKVRAEHFVVGNDLKMIRILQLSTVDLRPFLPPSVRREVKGSPELLLRHFSDILMKIFEVNEA